MIKILMLGNHSSNKGGMTSVINQILSHDWAADNIKLSFLPTFIPGNLLKKSLYFAYAYLRIFLLMLFQRPDIVHMHMSCRGSFTRKFYIHKLCKVFRVKDIIHLHGSEFAKWFNEVGESKKFYIVKLLNEASAFVVLGEKWKNVIKKIAPDAKITVISNGIEIPPETVHWDKKNARYYFLVF